MGFAGNKFFFLLCCVGFMAGFIYRILPIDSFDQYHLPPPKNASAKNSNLTYEESEFADLLKLIDWPSPPFSITNFSLSTNPKQCWYELMSPRTVYHVGETLEVLITAKDHYGKLKSYGGDFFQAKLHSPKIKAGVTGHLKDLNNGTYLATFLLPWEGEAQVNIRLIHSSEAVSVLKDKRERHPEKVYFNGYFHFNGSSEVKECNIAVRGGDVCNYSDPVTGDPWQCLKPQKMPCDSLVYHSMGGYRRVTNSLEDSLLNGSVTAQNIKGAGAFTSIKIEPATNSTALKRIDLHVNYQSGPLLAVDPDVGLVMRWRAHGNPLRTTKTMISDLHYETAHLYGIGGGPQTVVVFTLWAHFTTYPVSVYIQRLFRLRRAISSLLFRSPKTTVLIKSANTGYKSIYGSDWLSLQLDILLRAIFKGMAVTILDVWDMTSCHYLPDNIHPGAPVIRNEVDLMLSYICPR
ncbi:NXPE family member 3-like isoform X2 [Xenopus laevis]|uniref:NXPE family member 3-like isoform X2 n=1 Tax=Xenopus laevis TaxID=8355 RepID=A0A8J1MQF3_XENLA|nr:NXPE family member 3-like isoform X2 [Xenopus laevis]